MGRNHTFIDREFQRPGYDARDDGEFVKGLVGVAMPFDGEGFDEVYSVISVACRELGLTAQRVDKYVRSGVVLRDIATLIEEAEFLIFDLSLERQNVYYELGYAHGVGNESSDILLIAKQGTRLHYDVAGLRVHYYSSCAELRSILSFALAEMLKQTRKGSLSKAESQREDAQENA